MNFSDIASGQVTDFEFYGLVNRPTKYVFNAATMKWEAEVLLSRRQMCIERAADSKFQSSQLNTE